MDSHHCLPIMSNRVFVFAIFVLILSASCNQQQKPVSVDPAFSQYIESYTTGVVSKKNTISIRLANDVSITHAANEAIDEKIVQISPGVKGKAYWTDARTIEFKPDADLQPEQLYTINFALGSIMSVPAKFKDFIFNILVVTPSFEVSDYGLRSLGKDKMSLKGTITTADVEPGELVEKILKASVGTANLSIAWQHNESAKTHDFTLQQIPRSTGNSKLSLVWDGTPLNSKLKNKKEIDIPAQGAFTVLQTTAIQEDEQYVSVLFSDPIATGQMLEGLFTISDNESPTYTILGSEVKLYGTQVLDGNYTVMVNAGIQNQWGDKLAKSYTTNLSFENKLPSVSIEGSGSILPGGNSNLLLPFDAINLKAVDVTIIRIYENNVARFLQDNEFDGDESLRRVGKPLITATVRLDDDKTLNLHHHNRFSLSLDKYIRPEPGALYRVTIGFRPQYAVYTCTSMDKSDYYDYEYEEASYDAGPDEDDEFWDRYDDYYPYGYSWDNRDNPCNEAYYNKERFESRNILATNMALTAKLGTSKNLFVVVNDIITTEPVGSVQFEVLDYQQQIVGKGNSNSDGIAMIDIKRKPFLLIAKKGNERSYLKLSDNESLPLSHFDTDGEAVKYGIKGFIFGERGVWRPGDSLFLSCIINDKNNPLPKDHPIELDLINPTGQLYKHIVQSKSDNGFQVFRTVVDADAPTGNWECKVKAGGATFRKTIKIETIMPNRLKIDLNFGGITALGKDVTATGNLQAQWLFGAPAQNLKARIDAQLYKMNTTFKGFDAYEFDNPTSSFTAQSKTIFDGALSADGKAPVSASFTAGEDAPGQLMANLLVKVFEPGGSFSIDNQSMPYHPFSSYVGLKVPGTANNWGYLSLNQPQKFDIVNVNTTGALISSNTVVVELYKIQWRWWWDNSNDYFENFTQDNYNKLIYKDTVTTQGGKASFVHRFANAGWGRYLMLVKDTRSHHTTGSTFYIDDDSWQQRGNADDPSALAMLSIDSDKEKYIVGEEVKLTIPGSKGGKALISIETGNKVLKTFWVNTTQGQTKFAFKTEKEMSPNIYVNVSLIQPHAQTVNDLPIRMYGVVPIMVEDKDTWLKPMIKMPDEIKPEQSNTITVSEANGKKMSYVIAVVDEGLLDITKFKTPSPHDAFYAKEALGVKSWDVYDDVIGAFGAQIDRILTIGGDAEGDLAAKTRRANRFKPVVQFFGPYQTSGGSKQTTFKLPPYMGSVRVMVVAAGDAGYGMAEKSVKVKKPLMLLTTLPRVLGPAEELKIPVTVFVTDKNIKNVSLTIQSNNLLEAVGTQQVAVNGSGEQLVYFNAKVKNNTGIGTVKISAQSGKEQSISETEIEIRNANPYQTQVMEAVLQPGQSWSSTIAMLGDVGSSKATVELSTIPALNLEKRLNYLIQYPHGCVEQTTSSVFPQLYLSQIMDMNDAQKKQTDLYIKAGIQRLLNFQQADGGFSYWPGGNTSDEWGSCYAGHFLLNASAKGYAVSNNLLQSFKLYTRTKTLAWNQTAAPWYGSDLTQAYRLYVLALGNATELGAMNRLKEYKFLSNEAKWMLAAAYSIAGQQKIGLSLISGLPTNFAERTSAGFTYGSSLRDLAIELETLNRLGRKMEAASVVRTIAAQMGQQSWYSTQTTSWCLLAVSNYCGSNKDGKKILVNGKAGATDFSFQSSAAINQMPVGWQKDKATVSLTNKGTNVVFVRVMNGGKPIQPSPVPPVNNPEILLLNVSFINNTGAAIKMDSLKQGTDFIAKVTLKNPGKRGAYNEMALTQVFPSGWEILNTRLLNSEGAFQNAPADYMDIRDDRVYHYFDMKMNETLTYYVHLNAAYPGKYYWPGVYCEAMYEGGINASIPGKWVKVIE